MKQLIYIHGWDCFRSDEDYCNALKNKEYQPFQEQKNWKDRFKNKLKNEYEMTFPKMPNTFNARYAHRKIRFEKIFPFLNDDKLVIVWHSLWCTFLAKYLSENIFPKEIDQLHLIAGVFDEQDLPKGEDYLADFIFDPEKLKTLKQQTNTIFLYHSHDDLFVPIVHMEKYIKYLPHAMVNIFEDRGHFLQMEEFPELVENMVK